jgi:hypothetical protein
MSSVLENEIGLLEAEISKLNTKVTSLQDEKRNLEAQVREEKSKNSQITKIQNDNRNLLDLLKEKDQKMESLENEIILLKKENKTIKREVEKKYENEIGYYKNLNETNTTKVDNANIILKLNERQHEAILKLEDKIDEIKRADAEYQKQMQIKHDNQFTNLKRKMMDHIKNAQKNMAQSNLDNLDLNTKISKLTTNQLLIELEEQSYQIEDLLKEREKNKKEIFALKTELNTHKKVEHILQEKNKRYLNMVKACDKKIEKVNKKNNNNNSDDYDLMINDDNENMTNNNFQNFKKSEKMYNKLFKDYQNLKGVYESLRDRERLQQQKFEGIINIYNIAIDDLINDEELRNKTDIYVNIDEIKNGNFEYFNKEEKYSILVFLMKHLLPLVNSNNNDINTIKEQINSVEIAYKENNTLMNKTSSTKFRTRNINTLKTPYHTRQNTFNTDMYKTTSNINSLRNKTYTKFPKIGTLFSESNRKQKDKDSKILFRFLSINKE